MEGAAVGDGSTVTVAAGTGGGELAAGPAEVVGVSSVEIARTCPGC
jgi:hypothetical protein